MRVHPLWRGLAAASLAATAGLHVALVPEHLREAPYAAALFIALSASCLLLALLIVTWGDRRLWGAGTALVGAAMVAYLLSRSVGLPAMQDDIGDWLNPLGVAALACELVGAVICLRAAMLWRKTRTISPPVRKSGDRDGAFYTHPPS